MNIKDTNGLLKVKSADEQVSELLEELENKATEDKEPSELESSIDTADVYEGDEEKAEDVGSVEITESEEPETDATEDKAPEEVESDLDTKDVYNDDTEEAGEDVGSVDIKEELDVDATEDKDPKELESSIDTADVYEGDEEKAEDVGSVEITEELEPEDDDSSKDLEAEDPNVAEAKEDNDGKDDLEPADSKVDDDKKDDESDKDDEDKKDDDKKDDDKEDKEDKEDVNESALFELLRSINESLSTDSTVEKDPSELESSIDTEDVYGDDEEKAEDVGSVEIKEELEIDATEDKEPEELESAIDTEDVYEGDEEKAEDVGSVEITEELEVEATEDKDPSELESSIDTEDVYGDDEEKAEDVGSVEIKESNTVKDIVTIVVEAAKHCKDNGIPASISNICEAAESELAAMMGTGDKPADKEYDVDAAIESEEMNGSDKFEKYEEIQGDQADAALTGETPASAVHESVKYTSLKEACLLDEDYFTTDSYVKETADDKVQKLTEQISLLMAREAMDPAYDELLKESVYCIRLQESIKAKYLNEACKRAQRIVNRKK